MIVPSLITLRAHIISSHEKINQNGHVLVINFHSHGSMMQFTILCKTSNIYFASCPFNACTLTTSSGILNLIPPDANNVILTKSF